jgi:hypothetical protein
MLTFEEKTHIYKWNGKPIRSVTQTIEDGGLDSPWGKDEKAAKFGREFHILSAEYERGHEVSFDPAFEPYLASWESFRKDMENKGWALLKKYIETPMYSEQFGYAGTLDMPFKHLEKQNTYLIVDEKTGSKTGTWGIQLAGYCQLFSEFPDIRVMPSNIERMAVIIRADGYEPVPYDRRKHIIAFNLFQSLLNIQRFKEGRYVI